MSVVAVLVISEDKVLLGKHRTGPFAGSWGVASADAGSERPQRAAGRVAEYCSFGLLGARRPLEDKVKKVCVSPTGIHVYTIDAPIGLVDQLRGVTSYITSCFAMDAHGPVCPQGLLPWSEIKWMTLEDALARKTDKFSVESLRSYGITLHQ
jgi:hypothetical protein